MENRIFVLSGHLGEGRLGHALAQTYADAAQKGGAQVCVMNLNAMQFDPALRSGDYKGDQPLEPDVVAFQENLRWCTHWALIYPLWWGGMPGPMQGLLDRALLPGFAFGMEEGNDLPISLLSGRSARVIITSDMRGNEYEELYDRAHDTVMSRHILSFIGIKEQSFTMFSPTYLSTPEERAGWLAEVEQFGELDARVRQSALV